VQRQNRNQRLRFIIFMILILIGGYHVLATHVVDTAQLTTEKRKTNLREPHDNGLQVKVDTSSVKRKILFTVNLLEGVPGTIGQFVIQVEPSWAPIGAARVVELTSLNFFENCRFFRVLPSFMSQFGIASDPSLNKFSNLLDDPVKEPNDRGTVSFATSGPNTRSTQIFINTNTGGNRFLDGQGFAPFGRVIEGMDVVDRLYSGYGEGAPSGEGPDQGKIYSKGNEYLEKDFPRLSFIVSTQFLN
jgi:peptidyl-prolyl cis-trans isomerase A (cyclophilin A)